MVDFGGRVARRRLEPRREKRSAGPAIEKTTPQIRLCLALFSEENHTMRVEQDARTLLRAAALCGLLVCAGCNHALSSANSGGPSGGAPIASVKTRGDWGASLLAGGSVGVGMFPAKFTFDVNAVPSCANDYVAFNMSLAGASPTANASQGGNTFSGSGIPNGTLTITHGTTSLAWTAGTTFAVVNNNSGSGTGATTNATNLAAAIASLGGPIGVMATSSGPTVTITALT